MKAISSLPVLLLLALLCSDLQAASWPVWRGPNLDGKATSDGLLQGDFELAILWTRPLGRGYSSFSVAGGKALTLFGDGEKDHFVALDATSGKELWRHTLGPTYRGHDGSADGPIGTPTIDGQMAYALGPRGLMIAVELEKGELQWKLDLVEDLGAKPPFYGFSTSPVVFGDLLVVQVGGSEGRSICGLDKQTGELRWKAGQDSVSNQLPLPIEVEGKTQFLAVTDTRLTGLDPETGQVFWTHQHSPQPQYVPTYPQPVLVSEERLLLTFEKHAELFEMVALDGEVFLGELWRTTHLKGSEAVPIVDGDYLYGFNGNFLTCVEAKSGREVWKSRQPGGRGLIMADQHLIIFAPSGEVVIVEATPEAYREKARIHVDESGGLTPPSFAEKLIFVRNQRIAAAIQIKPEAKSAPEANTALKANAAPAP